MEQKNRNYLIILLCYEVSSSITAVFESISCSGDILNIPLLTGSQAKLYHCSLFSLWIQEVRVGEIVRF